MRTSIPSVRGLVLICLLVISSLRSHSQSITSGDGRFEIGLGIGPSFFLGDLGGTQGKGRTFVKDVNFPYTKLMKGIFVGFYPTEWLGFRLAGNIGVLEGDDHIIDVKGGDERFRYNRNLKFKSNIKEAYLAMELYPTVFLEQFDGLFHKIRPYGVAGVGMFHFNPQGEYTDPSGQTSWVYLKPLMLEGQGMAEYPDRKPYALWQQEITMGAGLKYYLQENFYVGIEILHRKTFTDYIDDVSTNYINPNYFSNYLDADQAAMARQLHYRTNLINPTQSRPYIDEQRGDPKENDAFFSGMLRFGWRINGANSPNSNIKRQLKCPVFY